MARASATKSVAPKGKRTASDFPERSARRSKVVERDAETGDPAGGNARVEAVMSAAERSGLLSGKSGRIGGRVSPALVEQAKRQTGIATDTDLIEFALATVALEDDFAESFKKSRGKVDPELELGY
jgi:hypothetical protein